LRRLLLSLALLAICSSPTYAHDQQWGVSIWGLSYHTDRSVDYNELNWGLGLRYATPEPWLGATGDNRLFFEVDALRDSNRGLALPISAGAEFRIAPLPAGCKLFASAALTVAYYQYANRDTADIKVGPVPGISIGCGRVRTNVEIVLRKSSEPLAALTASLTILF
jgi:hypothetical protein